MSLMKISHQWEENTMTFFKEGRKLNYAEVVETLDMLIKQNILSQLETEEIYNLFLKLFKFTEDVVEHYLEEIGYKVVNSKQTFFTASKLKIVSDIAVWNESIQVKKDIETEGHNLVSKEMLIAFMSEPYYQAMKVLKINLESKQKQK